MKMKKNKNPYKKHIPVSEMVGAELRDIKVRNGLHSINEVVIMLLKGVK